MNIMPALDHVDIGTPVDIEEPLDEVEVEFRHGVTPNPHFLSSSESSIESASTTRNSHIPEASTACGDNEVLITSSSSSCCCRICQLGDELSDMEEMDCIPANILHRVYMMYEDRLSTFKPHWSKQILPTAPELAKAGFYYTGQGDTVVCFACNIRLREWQSNEDPLSEHYKWSSDCDFLKMIGYNELDLNKVKNQDSDKPCNLDHFNSTVGFSHPPPPPPPPPLPTTIQSNKFQFQQPNLGAPFGTPTTSQATTIGAFRGRY